MDGCHGGNGSYDKATSETLSKDEVHSYMILHDASG